MKNDTFVITAAGGNATAIRVLAAGQARQEYARLGKELMAETEGLGVEQCGFLIPSDYHFEMAGGEFCGNAARSAAILFFLFNGEHKFEFTMSGFPGKVKAAVNRLDDKHYDVTCIFPDLSTKTTPVKALGQDAVLVDLGGIVHVVIESEFPKDGYQAQHRQITHDLQLTERSAVGVCWIDRDGQSINMHPVVWVRDIDSFFYETSCGSGTIAVGKVTNASSVVQPTGQTINVNLTPTAVLLQSNMEVIHEYERH